MDGDLWNALREEVQRRGKRLDHKSPPASGAFHIPEAPTIYETDHFAVLNKNPGIVVSLSGDMEGIERHHRPVGSRSGISPELQDIIAKYSNFPISGDIDFAHGILHRLDKDTSGALLVAKTYQAFYDFRFQFACQKVKKEYLCLADGNLGTADRWRRIDSPIATRKTEGDALRIHSSVDDGGKPALTEILPVATYKDRSTGSMYTLTRVKLHSGRAHQIRVHMASIGHPLFCDTKYGKRQNNRIFLHACQLGFLDPDGSYDVFADAPLPDDLQGILDIELERLEP
jgi:23S rRNA pseudouridine1911/1915/1917 synthase